MRFLAGFLCLMLASVALAQARGQVESVGFGGQYRPGCWTPMVVQLVPTTGADFRGRIEVVQEDLDRDQVLFTRQISLTGNPPSGTPNDQRFWMYFMPQPNRDRGELRENLRPDELTEIIKVRLCTDSGKELVKLPITQTLRPVERLGGSQQRGAKLVLVVYDRNQPSFAEYAQFIGLNEDISVAQVRDLSTGLPDDVRGYDAVDVIVWTDANPAPITGQQMAALEQFVRRGGKLVICQDTQTNQWQRNNANFANLMPVVVTGVEEREDHVATLRELAGLRPYDIFLPNLSAAETAWGGLGKGPFRYAIADPKPGATVVLWQKDPKYKLVYSAQSNKAIPYAVRHPVGAGSVTWVAQDLGDRQILGRGMTTPGWVKIWDPIIDWPNDPVFDSRLPTDRDAPPYREGITWELGGAYLKSMNLDATSAALIGIAILFFIVYWVAAGPGSFLVLSKKGKSSMSWFAFAAIGIAATGLTVGIVKLVLRGAPRLQHLSIVRAVPGESASVRSQFGLYIPRDGYQKIELKEADPARSSYVTAFNLHPAFNTEASEFPARQEYAVPVKELQEKDRNPADPKVIRVPYRSTLKKMSARWSGNLQNFGGINGTIALVPDHDFLKVAGTLTNNTGVDLSRVFLAVHHPHAIRKGDGWDARDLVLYVSSWPKGAPLSMDLFGHPEIARRASLLDVAESTLVDKSNPGNVRLLRGYILSDRDKYPGNWTEFFYESKFRQNFGGGDVIDDALLAPATFPVLSFFDRLPPSRNSTERDATRNRFDFLRRGSRDLDMSATIGAGQMAVVAVGANDQAELPFPLEVEGDRVSGKGIVYYQFVVPVDRTPVNKTPTTQRSTSGPATKPAAATTSATPNEKGKAD